MFSAPRAYQSTTPTANAYLKKKWDEKVYKLHREKLANMKPYVDCSSPKVYPHLQQRLKKYVAEEYRMALIQRDNYTLITKMAAIMQGKGTLDNWNNYRIMSFNGGYRQRVQLRIAQENQGVLARIEASRPYYDHKKWLRDWVENKSYEAYIAKYPHAGIHRNKKLKGKKKSSSALEGVYWPSNKLLG